MRQFNIYKTMMKYLTDENLSLNTNDLYGHQIISDKTMEDIRIAYNTKTKEKDDFEL